MARRFTHRRSPPGATGTHHLTDMPQVRLGSSPTAVDNRDLVVSVLDQGDLGACALAGWSNAIRSEMVRQAADDLVDKASIPFTDALAVVLQAPPELPCELLLYWAAAAYDGNAGRDEGTNSYAVSLALANYGYCEESRWPYKDDPSALDPGTLLEEFKRDAYDQRFSATARVDSDTMDETTLVAAVRASLGAKYILPFAIEVTRGFEALQAGEIWTGPDDGTEIVGGHLTDIIGIGPATSLCPAAVSNELALLMLNSWSEDFADGGYYLLSVNALRQRWDIWCASKVPTTYSGTR